MARYAPHLNLLCDVINEGGRIIVYANHKAVTLEDTDDGFRVSIANKDAPDVPRSWTHFAYWGEAFADLMATIKDIHASRRMWDDGEEHVKESQ
jgi:hypothetical protein